MVKSFEIKAQQPADDDDDDDDEDEDDSSVHKTISKMMDSLIKRIITSELEDFELVS